MKIQVKPYGNLPDGRQVDIYTMENSGGMSVSVITFGGVITNLLVPDKQGNLADVVLAHQGLDCYLKNPGCFGAMVGRNSNRIGNARIEIKGKQYALTANSGKNNLHGGPKGMIFRLFDADVRCVNGEPVLLLKHTINDMDDEFPGQLDVSITLTLTNDNSLVIDYRAVSDKDTIINLTNHSYFNLAGHGCGDILGHTLEMNADFYTPATPECLPTGEILSVAGTAFDFRNAKLIGKDIGGECPQLKMFGGYDHNFMLGGSGYRKIATLSDPASGRNMAAYTDLPCVQLYTANNLSASVIGKDGAAYRKHGGVCLETQTCPNAAQMPWLVSPIYAAGQEYISTTAYQFDWQV